MTIKWQGDRNDAYVSIGHIDLNAWRIGSKFHWSVSTCGVEGETMAQADEPTIARAKVAAVDAARDLLTDLLTMLPKPKPTETP